MKILDDTCNDTSSDLNFNKHSCYFCKTNLYNENECDMICIRKNCF